MTHELKIGDIVRLKSASPPMVVEDIVGSNVHVVWVGYSTHTVVRDVFKPEVLTLDPKTPAQQSND